MRRGENDRRREQEMGERRRGESGGGKRGETHLLPGLSPATRISMFPETPPVILAPR